MRTILYIAFLAVVSCQTLSAEQWAEPNLPGGSYLNNNKCKKCSAWKLGPNKARLTCKCQQAGNYFSAPGSWTNSTASSHPVAAPWNWSTVNYNPNKRQNISRWGGELKGAVL